MDKSEEKQIRSSINNSEKKINNSSMKTPDNASKPSKKFMKYNTNHTYLNTVYLQSRDRYQKYVSNIDNSEGLKFLGNKLYENLPVNKFKDDYILNTFNITKELENKILGYFSPLSQRETSRDKKLDGEKINLTPIPFKKAEYIHNKVERKKIQEIKRSSVFMRRVEYTHLIQNFKEKNKENNEKNMNLVNKIAVLKGATLIIEDWWKRIKRKRTEADIHKRINLFNFDNNNNKNNDINKNINVVDINRELKENKEKNQLLHNDSSEILKSNKNNNESSLSINSNNLEKINANINKKNSEINDNDITNNSKSFRKVNENHNHINSSNLYKKTFNKKPLVKNNNKRVNILYSSTMIESMDRIKKGIFEDLNKNHYIKKKIKNKNNLGKKSTNDHTSLKNSMSFIDNNQGINNLKMNNNLQKKYTTELRYDLKDIDKFNNPSNSYLTLKMKKNKTKKINMKKRLELVNKNDSDMSQKLNNLNDNKRDNNSQVINLKENYNTVNNTNIKSQNLKNDNNLKNESKISELNNNHKKNKKFTIKQIYIDLDKNINDNENNNNDFNNSVNNKENPNENNKVENENKISNNINKKIEEQNNLNQNDLIKEKKKNSEGIEKLKKIEYNRSNSFKNKQFNNNEFANKIINKKREKKNHNNNLKSEEFSFSINKAHAKRFENLKIIASNETLFINNYKSQIIENIDNNFDFDNISNPNYNSSNSKQNNMRFSKNKENIESRNQLEENNLEIDDSEIVPIEPDNQKNFILSEFLKQKSNKNESVILSFNNSKYKGNNNFLIRSNKNRKNNNIDNNSNKKNNNELSKSAIEINIPKTVKNNILGDNKNKDIHKNKIIYNSVRNNSIELNGLEDDNDENNPKNIIYIGGSSKNNDFLRLRKKRKFININRSMSVPKHIKEIHKLYRNRSAKEIKRKKDKRFEYIRSPYDKFEFEI